LSPWIVVANSVCTRETSVQVACFWAPPIVIETSTSQRSASLPSRTTMRSTVATVGCVKKRTVSASITPESAPML
jgi:hypothetical protein